MNICSLLQNPLVKKLAIALGVSVVAIVAYIYYKKRSGVNQKPQLPPQRPEKPLAGLEIEDDSIIPSCANSRAIAFACSEAIFEDETAVPLPEEIKSVYVPRELVYCENVESVQQERAIPQGVYYFEESMEDIEICFNFSCEDIIKCSHERSIPQGVDYFDETIENVEICFNYYDFKLERVSIRDYYYIFNYSLFERFMIQKPILAIKNNDYDGIPQIVAIPQMKIIYEPIFEGADDLVDEYDSDCDSDYDSECDYSDADSETAEILRAEEQALKDLYDYNDIPYETINGRTVKIELNVIYEHDPRFDYYSIPDYNLFEIFMNLKPILAIEPYTPPRVIMTSTSAISAITKPTVTLITVDLLCSPDNDMDPIYIFNDGEKDLNGLAPQGALPSMKIKKLNKKEEETKEEESDEESDEESSSSDEEYSEDESSSDSESEDDSDPTYSSDEREYLRMRKEFEDETDSSDEEESDFSDNEESFKKEEESNFSGEGELFKIEEEKEEEVVAATASDKVRSFLDAAKKKDDYLSAARLKNFEWYKTREDEEPTIMPAYLGKTNIINGVTIFSGHYPYYYKNAQGRLDKYYSTFDYYNYVDSAADHIKQHLLEKRWAFQKPCGNSPYYKPPKLSKLEKYLEVPDIIATCNGNERAIEFPFDKKAPNYPSMPYHDFPTLPEPAAPMVPLTTANRKRPFKSLKEQKKEANVKINNLEIPQDVVIWKPTTRDGRKFSVCWFPGQLLLKDNQLYGPITRVGNKLYRFNNRGAFLEISPQDKKECGNTRALYAYLNNLYKGFNEADINASLQNAIAKHPAVLRFEKTGSIDEKNEEIKEEIPEITQIIEETKEESVVTPDITTENDSIFEVRQLSELYSQEQINGINEVKGLKSVKFSNMFYPITNAMRDGKSDVNKTCRSLFTEGKKIYSPLFKYADGEYYRYCQDKTVIRVPDPFPYRGDLLKKYEEDLYADLPIWAVNILLLNKFLEKLNEEKIDLTPKYYNDYTAKDSIKVEETVIAHKPVDCENPTRCEKRIEKYETEETRNKVVFYKEKTNDGRIWNRCWFPNCDYLIDNVLYSPLMIENGVTFRQSIDGKRIIMNQTEIASANLSGYFADLYRNVESHKPINDSIMSNFISFRTNTKMTQKLEAQKKIINNKQNTKNQSSKSAVTKSNSNSAVAKYLNKRPLPKLIKK